jgi:hypothetical protein
MMSAELERIKKERAVIRSVYHPYIYLQMLRKTMKNFK